jgi:outer membrane beta-barrel protein
MPFDGYTTTPVGSVSFTKHKSETLGFEGVLSGGYSLKNFTYRQLESDAYGIQPDAYRYLMSFTGGLQWSPIYAKMNWRGKKVLHHDIYGLAGVGGTLEQAMMPDRTMAFSPTLALGAGMRVFLNQKSTLRFQLRDEVIYEKRIKTADTQGLFIKQNVALTVGYGFVGGKK